VTGSVSGVVALLIGTPFGRAYDGTVLPLIAGFMTCALLSLLLTEWAERADQRRELHALEA
jgi:zinc transporter ZupT